MPGPLPKPADQRRRRNKPAIPTTNLPVSGRQVDPPDCPYDLGDRGEAWWDWAWHTPQACAWSEIGDVYALGRRAQLEDDLEALVSLRSGTIDVADYLEHAAEEGSGDALRSIDALIGRLQSLAGKKLAIAKEMRELDDRYGLTPKGMAALRWKIVDDESEEGEAAGEDDEVAKKRRERVKAVAS